MPWEQLEKELPLSVVEFTDGTFAVVPKTRFGERPSDAHEGKVKMCMDGGTTGSFLKLSQFTDKVQRIAFGCLTVEVAKGCFATTIRSKVGDLEASLTPVIHSPLQKLTLKLGADSGKALDIKTAIAATTVTFGRQ